MRKGNVLPIAVMALAITAFVFIIAWAVTPGLKWPWSTHPTKNANLVACTLEARICPDGSYVGRSGPKCEFTPCPRNSLLAVNDTATWPVHVSTQFHLSIQYPPTFTVLEIGHLLSIAKGNIVDVKNGSNNAFFKISDDPSYVTDGAKLKNSQNSTVLIDGKNFSYISGQDYGRYQGYDEGDDAGQVVDIDLHYATIHVEEKPAAQFQGFGVIPIANQMVSTIAFTQ